MTRKNIHIAVIIAICLLYSYGCSNQKNTFMSRQYHSLTTHYNVYFNGKESLKKGEEKIKKGLEENYTILLPVFEYENSAARSLAFSNMNRAIEKATKAIKIHSITRKPKRKKKQSEKYKQFRKQKEFNNWIDDCYMLIGKAQFYKGEHHIAEKAFEFIQQEYPESDLILEAKLWLARSYIDRGEYISGEEILSRIETDSKKQKKMQLDIAALHADVAIRQKKYEDAIPELQTCIANATNKRQKARHLYLLAQLYEKTGDSDSASATFQKLIDLNANYEMTFSAKINRALSYTGNENGEAIRKILKKMLRDDKNTEYQDQIYYAIAEMDVKDDNINAALPNYWKSTEVSILNDNQKAVSFLKLADYYFGEENYGKAQMCYDSSMTYLGSDYPNYKKISKRVGNLTELVNNLHLVEREDSLQRVAKMSERDRNNLIAGIIRKIEEKEQEERLKRDELNQDRAFYQQNNLQGNNRNNSTSQGNWYFYNPTTIGIGKSEFQRKWGRRKLEDNWRRKNKSVVIQDDLELASEDTENDDESIGKFLSAKEKDPKSIDYYLVDLPLTEAAVRKSDQKIMKGLYQASIVYEEKLNNEEKALETLYILLKRYPKNPYLLSAYYHCYSLNKGLGNSTQAEFYKQKILKDFKGSDYAKALSDPAFYAKLTAEKNKANLLYEQAYEDFLNYYYFKVIKLCNEGLLRYPESDLRPRFMFLRALCIGRTQDVEQFKMTLKEIEKTEATDEIKHTAKAILDGLEKGAVPMQYTLRDMEQARQNRLLRNWRIEEEALVELEDNKSKIEQKPKSLYQERIDEEHYFILLFDKQDGDANRTLFNVSRYNSDAYNTRTFKVDRLSLNKNQIMIIVKGLKNKVDAINYFNGIITNEKAFKGLEDVDYRNFVISISNYNIFAKNQDVGEYLNFYLKSYFNKERKVGKSTVKKHGKLISVKSSVEKQDFVYNKSDNHKFILLIPSRKVNINKLRNTIYNHDKDFKVLKEPYDSDLNMIVVNNIGSKIEAMIYFNKLLEDQKVYEQLKDVDYRNFVITEENFEKFYVNKSLFPYLEFFKKNYLAKTTKKQLSAKSEVVKDGAYTFDPKSPHYFVIVFPIENVNEKLLLSGIRKYNTKPLKTEIRGLDENRELLVVKNLRNKKQAMMYLRAVVTNRDLFAPIEKVGYRNFVISEDNLKVFMNESDPAIYLYFFEKYYLK